ncbi:helix-turn-helix domain-containing protein [Lactobacillus sp. PSON]|uniref:helix-turn-helix domain-containing protein n=1 Tax=Lactobacillus sp. PSON TaxID=3455454 RepID=UPI004042F9C0
MTTIGKELKKIRLTYGLTQREMSADVLDPTYYGIIERDDRRISIKDLLEILNRNGISIYEFFSDFDKKAVKQYRLKNRIQMACLTRDKAKIDNLLKLDEIKANELQTLQLNLVKAEISGGVNTLPKRLQNKIYSKRNKLLHIGEWNRDTLWELLITMPLFDQEEVASLIASVLERETWDNLTIELFAEVLAAYTARLYNEGNFAEAKKIIKIIKQLPTKPTLMLYKVLAIYYSDLIDKNSRSNKITCLLKSIKYSKFLRTSK